MDQALFDTQWGGRPIATGYDRDGFVIGMPPYFNEFGWKGGVPGSLDAVQGGVSSSHMLPNGSPSQAYPELSRVSTPSCLSICSLYLHISRCFVLSPLLYR